ncbi:MAG: class I SAM-dependent methyltransferase [Deltaproteobacteria bacterium]|nr:class I SAM-dependent methyltransferase [Deltaproteobacteria bacterium]
MKKLYEKYLLPLLMDYALKDPRLEKYRKDLVKSAKGKVLEIGLGTGLNLSHYPKHIQEITSLENNSGMKPKALEHLSQSHLKLHWYTGQSEKMPFNDQSFDTVVSSFTLCSLKNIQASLKEIHRVLKEEGRFLFLEHGLSHDPQVAKWQRRLNPLQQSLGGGCQLTRNMGEILNQAGFSFEKLSHFDYPHWPKIWGSFYQGVAKK